MIYQGRGSNMTRSNARAYHADVSTTSNRSFYARPEPRNTRGFQPPTSRTASEQVTLPCSIAATKQANLPHESTKDGDSDDLYGASDNVTSKRSIAIKPEVLLNAPKMTLASSPKADQPPKTPKPYSPESETKQVGLEGSIWAYKETKSIRSNKLDMDAKLPPGTYSVDKKWDSSGQSADKTDPKKNTFVRTVGTKVEATKEVSGNVKHTKENGYIPPHLRIPEPRLVKVAEDPMTPEATTASPASANLGTEVLAKPEIFTPAMTEPEEDSSHLAPHLRPNKMAEEDHSYVPPHLRPSKAPKAGDSHSAPHLSPSIAQDEDYSHLPPHLRPPKVLKTEADEEKLHRIMANQPSLSTGEDKDKHVNGTASNSREPNAKTKKVTKLEKIMIAKGWSPPKAGSIRPEGDWYNPADEPWEQRPSHSYKAPEHVAALEAWVDDRLQDIPSQPVFTGISSAGFVDGTEIPDGERVHSSPTDGEHDTRRLADPFTEAKGSQTAQSAMEKYQQKKQLQAPEPPKPPKYTKQEKREAREAYRKRQQYYLEMEANHPNKPDIDIYIRRAETSDLGTVTELYNWYIENTCIAHELETMEWPQWQARMDHCRREGYEMFVAVLKLGKGERHDSNHEPVVGFGYAIDLGGNNHSYRFTAQVKVYVSHEYPHLGIGRCLFDRMMGAVDVNHQPQGGCEWRGPPMSKQREISRVYVEIPYFENDAAEKEAVEWKKRWLCGFQGRASMRFEHYATQPGFGFKQGKRVDVAQFSFATHLDLTGKRDIVY